jgi:hypothetical protein
MRIMCSAIIAIACAATISGEALAKTTKHHRQTQTHHSRGYSITETPGVSAGAAAVIAPPRRSWLDPGVVVPPGSTQRYVLDQTFYNRDPIERYQRSWYMQETAPNRWQVTPYDPGWPFWWP